MFGNLLVVDIKIIPTAVGLGYSCHPEDINKLSKYRR